MKMQINLPQVYNMDFKDEAQENTAEKPNKKYYDPRVWLRAGQENLIARLQVAFSDLNYLNKN